MKRISKIYDHVVSLLKEQDKYRDSDTALSVRIWYDELSRRGVDIHSEPIAEFFKMYRDEQVSNADSITRARRKAQEEQEELRGVSYSKRHKHTDEVKEDIRSI